MVEAGAALTYCCQQRQKFVDNQLLGDSSLLSSYEAYFDRKVSQSVSTISQGLLLYQVGANQLALRNLLVRIHFVSCRFLRLRYGLCRPLTVRLR